MSSPLFQITVDVPVFRVFPFLTFIFSPPPFFRYKGTTLFRGGKSLIFGNNKAAVKAENIEIKCLVLSIWVDPKALQLKNLISRITPKMNPHSDRRVGRSPILGGEEHPVSNREIPHIFFMPHGVPSNGQKLPG
jgi:hypothetical protein